MGIVIEIIIAVLCVALFVCLLFTMLIEHDSNMISGGGMGMLMAVSLYAVWNIGADLTKEKQVYQHVENATAVRVDTVVSYTNGCQIDTTYQIFFDK